MTVKHEVTAEEINRYLKTGVWPVRIEPEITLSSWRVFDVDFDIEKVPSSYHLVGIDVSEGDGRVSSPIRKMDLALNIVTTRSGRLYRLAGQPGSGGVQSDIWKNWQRMNRVRGYGDVTHVISEMSKHEQKRIDEGKAGRILRIDDAGKANLFDPSGLDTSPDDPLA